MKKAGRGTKSKGQTTGTRSQSFYLLNFSSKKKVFEREVLKLANKINYITKSDILDFLELFYETPEFEKTMKLPTLRHALEVAEKGIGVFFRRKIGGEHQK